MQFFKAITLFSLAATGLAAATGAPENNGESAPAKVVVGEGEPLDGDFDAAHYLATRSEYMINKRGYGCPNDYSCSHYCSSIGRNGGYCGGFLWQTCKCNEKK